MLDRDDWKTALEDARFRHNAILGLVYAADSQALALLRLFLTIAMATAAGAASSLSSTSVISVPLGWAMTSATLVLVFSAWQCLRAIGVSDINLPGRGAEFWLWAAETPKDRTEVFMEYLRVLKDKHGTNNALNEKQTKALRAAKLGGVLSPLAALLTGAAMAIAELYF